MHLAIEPGGQGVQPGDPGLRIVAAADGHAARGVVEGVEGQEVAGEGLARRVERQALQIVGDQEVQHIAVQRISVVQSSRGDGGQPPLEGLQGQGLGFLGRQAVVGPAPQRRLVAVTAGLHRIQPALEGVDVGDQSVQLVRRGGGGQMRQGDCGQGERDRGPAHQVKPNSARSLRVSLAAMMA